MKDAFHSKWREHSMRFQRFQRFQHCKGLTKTAGVTDRFPGRIKVEI